MKRALTTADRVLTVLQTRTQVQAAKYLGVSERTIRRWKNEGVQPLRPHRKTLVEKSGSARHSLVRRARREGARVLGGSIPVPVERVMKLDPFDPKRKRRIVSDTLMYRIGKTSRAGILEIMKSLRGTGSLFRLVMDLKPGLPDSKGKVHRKKHRYSTAWDSIDRDELTLDAELLRILDDELESAYPVYLVVAEQSKKKRKSRQKRKG